MAVLNKQMDLNPRQASNGQRLLRLPGITMEICTWNVRTMYQAGKLDNAIQEVNKWNIDAMEVSKLRWK